VGFVVGFLTIVYFITCGILIIVVLMQEPKGGGLSSAFGGSGLDTAFGASIGRKMSSFRVYLAAFFMVLTIVLAVLGRSEAESEPVEGLGQPPAPTAPAGEPGEGAKPGAPPAKAGTQAPAGGAGRTAPGTGTQSKPAGDR
jgi:preprotein translocase subunit SecG